MNTRHNSILDTIGNTPVVKLNHLAPEGINLFVKVEAFNPMGSVKDRLALGVIEDAERSGELKPGQTIVEATSGNTGIGLAMVCAQKGYPLVIVMAESFSVERRRLIRFLGAKVVLTPASLKGMGMVDKAAELAKEHGWWQPKQFENPANAQVHADTTAMEILNDFSDIPLDYWVSGFGTGGTLNGIARVLKEQRPETQIIVCEPDNSQILASNIPQPKNGDGSHSASHPKFRPHLMQGWSPDFIPKLAEQVVQNNLIDAFVPVDGLFSLQCARDLARKEGILAGTTSGATLAGALKISETAPKGSNILVMLPDTGERYMSTPLFEDVLEEMDEEEIAISRSSPGYRFDVPNPVLPIVKEAPVILDENAIEEVTAFINDPKQPIVMFGLQWCEFCWSVRKMLAKYEIDFISVNIDSVEYDEGNRGQKFREVVRDKTTWNTFPQIFIGGKFVGGCTDIFDQCKDGSLGERLDKLDITFNRTVTQDPYTFLPKWLHPR
jgi:cysteine synthase A